MHICSDRQRGRTLRRLLGKPLWSGEDCRGAARGQTRLRDADERFVRGHVPVTGECCGGHARDEAVRFLPVYRLRRYRRRDSETRAPVVVPKRTTFYGATEIFVREPGGNLVGFAQF